jgi:hypothetical protein
VTHTRDDRSDDYLWTGRGTPDPEIARLERLLAPYAHRGAPLHLEPREPARRAVRWLFPLLTAAASILLVAAAASFRQVPERSAWTVRPLEGTPLVGGSAVDGSAHLKVGQALTTDGQSRAQLAVESVGRVNVDPNSRVRLLEAHAGEQRMALDRGRIRAEIWAPPRRFYVNTPSSVAVDLGCAYTLDVDERGWGLVHVTVGWVAFEYRGREAFIPQDAVCATRPRVGPGTPHYQDAPPELVNGLSILDFPTTESVNRGAALDAVLGAARRRDALTLWHLLSRGSRDERARVYDRLNALVPAPATVSRQAVLAGDRQALDAWWNELGLDSASWWRLWKNPWQDR